MSKYGFQNRLLRLLDVVLAFHMFMMWIGSNVPVMGHIVPPDLKLILFCKPVVTLLQKAEMNHREHRGHRDFHSISL